MRHLQENAGAVAGVGFATASAAMVEVHQDAQALPDDLVDFLPLTLTTKPTPQASCSN